MSRISITTPRTTARAPGTRALESGSAVEHIGQNAARFLPVTAVLVATVLTVAACGVGGVTPRAAAPGTARLSVGSPSAQAGYSPRSAASPAPPVSEPADQTGLASALAAWHSAATAPAATRNTYLEQAAGDLQAADNPGYDMAINELTYLANLPATNDSPAQRASAQSNVQALDSFFGTPGLMS